MSSRPLAFASDLKRVETAADLLSSSSSQSRPPPRTHRRERLLPILPTYQPRLPGHQSRYRLHCPFFLCPPVERTSLTDTRSLRLEQAFVQEGPLIDVAKGFSDSMEDLEEECSEVDQEEVLDEVEEATEVEEEEEEERL